MTKARLKNFVIALSGGLVIGLGICLWNAKPENSPPQRRPSVPKVGDEDKREPRKTTPNATPTKRSRSDHDDRRFLARERIRVYLNSGHYSDTPILDLLFFRHGSNGKEVPVLIREIAIRPISSDLSLWDLDCSFSTELHSNGAWGVRLGIADLPEEKKSVYDLLRKGARYRVFLGDLSGHESRHEITVPSTPKRGQIHTIKIFVDSPVAPPQPKMTTISGRLPPSFASSDKVLEVQYCDSKGRTKISRPVNKGKFEIKTTLGLGGKLRVVATSCEPGHALYLVDSVTKNDLTFPGDADWEYKSAKVQEVSFNLPPDMPIGVGLVVLRRRPDDIWPVLYVHLEKNSSRTVMTKFIPGKYALSGIVVNEHSELGEEVALGTVVLRAVAQQ